MIPKIADLVTVATSYASAVNVRLEFANRDANARRMASYRPIKSHRVAFARMARALRPLDDRVYLLTGNYGTGKSHLLLMLANYLADDPASSGMKAFFANYREQDPTEADH